MNRADRGQWAAARTLADVGELTARWIEGGIASQPGYYGPSDIEDPDLVPLLARLNRAGFVTTGSQAGESGQACGGGSYKQRAAVEGFAGEVMARRLVDAARAARVIVAAWSPETLPRRRYRDGQSVVVTTVNGRDCTWFGTVVPRRHIRSRRLGYGGCHRNAVRALCQSWQVTVIDPEWGRAALLWDVLDGALSQMGAAS